jgi:hypothetical protein
MVMRAERKRLSDVGAYRKCGWRRVFPCIGEYADRRDCTSLFSGECAAKRSRLN